MTVAQLHRFDADKKYTVTQVVRWHLDRIDRYNGVYGAIETVFRAAALAEARRQDADAATANHGPLWGVPIVIKANTSIKGQVTSAGWEGFTRLGHELIAPQDATIVTKFKVAGAIIVGHTNMPDLANSDTNRSSSFGRTGNADDVRFSPDAAIALAVMTGVDPLDAATTQTPASKQPGPYEPYLKADVLKGKRFGVPAFILAGEGVPFHGIPAKVPGAAAEKYRVGATLLLRPETLQMFLKAVEALRAAGAEVVVDAGLLPAAFAKTASRVATYAYMQDGTNRFLAAFGPAGYHSAADYLKATGKPLFTSSIGSEASFNNIGGVRIDQRLLDADPDAERNYHAPKRATLAAYLETMDRLKLDGYVYPAIQMPPPDETMAQDGALSGGPHSNTSWVNMIGVPAVVVPAGFYESGLPFGLEFSSRPWTDGDLLAVSYAWEQATKRRKPPTLVEQGLLPTTPARPAR